MNLPLVMAGLLTILFGIVHSVVGERRFLAGLENKHEVAREALISPWQLSVLRATWHTLSLFGFGLAGVFFTLAFPWLRESVGVTTAIAIACGAVGLYWAYVTKFWHLASVGFLLVAFLCGFA